MPPQFLRKPEFTVLLVRGISVEREETMDLDRRSVKRALAEVDITLADACRKAGLPYYRVLRAVNGYARPLGEEEAQRLRSALEPRRTK